MKIQFDEIWEAFLRGRFPVLVKAEEAIFKAYHISIADLRSPSRQQHLVFARIIFAELCKEVRPKIYLAAYLNRDHASLYHYRKQYSNLSSYKEFAEMQAEIFYHFTL